MMERAVSAVIVTAAAAAAAVLVVFAAGFALYALVEPELGAAGAAGVVALVAGLCLVIFALVVQHRARKEAEAAALLAAQQAEQLPFGLGELTRDRPIAALAITVVSGIVAARNPTLVRDLLQIVARFRR